MKNKINQKYYLIFKTRLKKLRLKNHLSLRSLSKKIGISSSCLSNYEKGKTLPNTARLKKIALFYSVKTDYLLGLCHSERTK